MAKIHVDDLFVLNRVSERDDEGIPLEYKTRSYTGSDYKDSVQEVIDDNKLDDRYVNLTGDTMNGILYVDRNISFAEEENPLCISSFGSTSQGQVVIKSPVSNSDISPHVSLVFTTNDNSGVLRRDHEIVTDTSLIFKSSDGNVDDDIIMLTLTDEYVNTDIPFLFGENVSEPQASIYKDGSSIFTKVTLSQTSPDDFNIDDAINKGYVDDVTTSIRDELLEYVTVEKRDQYTYNNGNQVTYTDVENFNYTSVGYVGSVGRLVFENGSTFSNSSFDYQNNTEYTTTFISRVDPDDNDPSGSNLTVQLVVDEGNSTDDNTVIVGIGVYNSGSNYKEGDVLQIAGGNLNIIVDSVFKGTTVKTDGGLSPVSNGEFRWRLKSTATSENWGEIDTFFYSPEDGDGNLLNIAASFPVGKLIDVRLPTLPSDEYLARYRITTSRIGAVNSVKEFTITEPGNNYFPFQDLSTISETGNGTGLTVDISDTNSSYGYISEVTIINSGVGYSVGDVIVLPGGDETGRITITSVEDTIPIEDESLFKIELEYLGFNFEPEDGEVFPQCSSSTLYDFEIKTEVFNKKPINGIFNWAFQEDAVEEFWDTLNRIVIADTDINAIQHSITEFPVGCDISFTEPGDIDSLYATYSVASSSLETIQVPDESTGFLRTYNYIVLYLNYVSSTSPVYPAVLEASQFDLDVIIDQPIIDEVRQQDQLLDSKIQSNTNSIVDIRDDIEALENAIISGILLYEPVLNFDDGPAPGKIDLISGGTSTPVFHDDVSQIRLSNLDYPTSNEKDWSTALVNNASVIILSNIDTDASATYLIENFEYVDGSIDGVDDAVNTHYLFTVSLVNATPLGVLSNTTPTRIKTRLLSDGISRQEGDDLYVNRIGDTINGVLSFNNTNLQLTTQLDPINNKYRFGSLESNSSPIFDLYGANSINIRVNDHNKVRIGGSSVELNVPLSFSDSNGEPLSIFGIKTAVDTELSYAANVEFVLNYVNSIVGSVVPSTKERLGPIKLDESEICTLNESNQLTIRPASTGGGIGGVGVARFNNNHFNVSTNSDGDSGVDYNTVSSKVLVKSSSSDDYGMVKVNMSTLKVGDDDRLYVRNASANSTGVMKVYDSTSNTKPSWSNSGYANHAASARALYYAHKRADDAYSGRFSGGMALHSTSTPSVGGIYKSGNTFYLKVS